MTGVPEVDLVVSFRDALDDRVNDVTVLFVDCNDVVDDLLELSVRCADTVEDNVLELFV